MRQAVKEQNLGPLKVNVSVSSLAGCPQEKSIDLRRVMDDASRVYRTVSM